MSNPLTIHQKIVNEFRALDEAGYIFACQASVPLIFTPDLLYQLWNNFKQYQNEQEPEQFHRIPHIVVSDLLLSDLISSVGFELFQFKKEIREILLAELVKNFGEKRRNTIAAFLQDYAQMENRYPQRKRIRDIHLLTAKSILDTAGMERQIIAHINDAVNDTERLNYLLLHKQLLPLGYDSGLGKISQALGQDKKEQLLSPILVPEENPESQGVLRVKLPGVLRTRIKKIKKGEGKESEERKTLALQLIKDCIANREIILDLAFSDLKDEDFIPGSELDLLLRQCGHLQCLILSNYMPQTCVGIIFAKYPSLRSRDGNEGPMNWLSKIPAAVGSLTSLRDFSCSGLPEFAWGIKDLSPIKDLRDLVTLDMCYNDISDLQVLSGLVYLQYVLLKKNKLSEINCTAPGNLKILDLQNNHLESLVSLAAYLKSSHHLPLRMSTSLLEVVPTYTIALNDNPIVDPPVHMLETSSRALVNYYFPPEEEDEGLIANEPNAEMFDDTTDVIPVVRIHYKGNDFSGFIVRGAMVHVGYESEPLLLTINFLAEELKNEESLNLQDVYVRFGPDIHSSENAAYASVVSNVLWHSSSDAFDVLIFRLSVHGIEELSEAYGYFNYKVAENLQLSIAKVRSVKGNFTAEDDRPEESYIVSYQTRSFRISPALKQLDYGAPLVDENNQLLGILAREVPSEEGAVQSAVWMYSLIAHLKKEKLGFEGKAGGRLIRPVFISQSNFSDKIGEVYELLQKMTEDWRHENNIGFDPIWVENQFKVDPDKMTIPAVEKFDGIDQPVVLIISDEIKPIKVVEIANYILHLRKASTRDIYIYINAWIVAPSGNEYRKYLSAYSNLEIYQNLEHFCRSFAEQLFKLYSGRPETSRKSFLPDITYEYSELVELFYIREIDEINIALVKDMRKSGLMQSGDEKIIPRLIDIARHIKLLIERHDGYSVIAHQRAFGTYLYEIKNEPESVFTFAHVFIRACCYADWDIDEQEKFDKVIDICSWYDIYISYTSQDAKWTNDRFLRFLADSVPKSELYEGRYNHNLLGRAIALAFRRQNLKVLDSGDPSVPYESEFDMAKWVENSFAMIQLLQPACFKVNPAKGSVMQYEYERFVADDMELGKMLIPFFLVDLNIIKLHGDGQFSKWSRAMVDRIGLMLDRLTPSEFNIEILRIVKEVREAKLNAIMRLIEDKPGEPM